MFYRAKGNDSRSLPFPAGVLKGTGSSQRVQDRALVGVQGAKPSDDLQILHFTVPR